MDDDKTWVDSGSSPEASGLAEGQRVGEYAVVRLLGRGAMGEVYEAEHTRLGRRYALKILPASLAADPAFRNRFETEARTLARLDHPNIVGISYAGEDQGRFYLVMELLRPFFAERQSFPLPEAEVRSVLSGLLGALDYAHNQGIVHRDLKPANLLRAPDGSAKVADFGVALVVGEDYVQSVVQETIAKSRLGEAATVAGAPSSTDLAGTLYYMAPEVVQGGQATARSDLYAVGFMTYEMLTGRKPIGMFRPPGHYNGSIAPGWDSLVGSLLEADPEERPQSASDALDRLNDPDFNTTAAQAPGPAAPGPAAVAATAANTPSPPSQTNAPPQAPPPATGKPPKKRGRLLTRLAALLLITGLLGAAGYFAYPFLTQTSGTEPDEPATAENTDERDGAGTGDNGTDTTPRALARRRAADAADWITNAATPALAAYRLQLGTYPTTDLGLDALVRQPGDMRRWGGPYLDADAIPADPWGNPYRYAYPAMRNPDSAADAFDLYSMGPDGQPGGGDDIVNWDPANTSLGHRTAPVEPDTRPNGTARPSTDPERLPRERTAEPTGSGPDAGRSEEPDTDTETVAATPPPDEESAPASDPGTTAAPASGDGPVTVLGVSPETGLVYLDYGSEKGARFNQSLTLYNGENPAATLTLVEVRNDASVARIARDSPGLPRNGQTYASTPGTGPPSNTAEPAGPLPADTFFPLALAGRPLQARLAITDTEQSAGLAGVRSLPADSGLLYLFERTARWTFSAENTAFDLDAGFFDSAGKLLEVRSMRGGEARPVSPESPSVRMVLTMPRGWFDRNNIVPGHGFELGRIALAVRARGFDPADYVPGAGGRAVSGSDTWFPLRIGTVPFQARLALTDEEQSRGLSGMWALPEDGGMLYVFRALRRWTFSAENTPMAIDIGFFDTNGTLLEVRRMQPRDATPVSPQSSRIRFVLEMPEGWFAQNRLSRGARLDLEAVRQALIARGADPGQYRP